MKKRATATANESQQQLLRMSSKVKGSVDRVIRFANRDVPEYLKNLERFDEESRKVRFVVK
jgi:hypothetical protein